MSEMLPRMYKEMPCYPTVNAAITASWSGGSEIICVRSSESRIFTGAVNEEEWRFKGIESRVGGLRNVELFYESGFFRNYKSMNIGKRDILCLEFAERYNSGSPYGKFRDDCFLYFRNFDRLMD